MSKINSSEYKLSSVWEKDFRAKRELINHWLEKLLPPADSVPQVLHEAMRYSVMAGGKRVRPMLALYAYAMNGKDPLDIIKPACALEYIHTYSLIHDDLPCMDDDDLRRGQPTVHKKFTEAVAVLAGDALHAYAFELLASSGDSHIVSEVAQAIGNYGMLGGQICDILAENKKINLEEIEHIHARKTGALIRVSVRIGAILGGLNKEDIQSLSDYGMKVGLAFQIVDDMLDVVGETALLGKTVGKDDLSGKATYPKVVGLEQSSKIAGELIKSAKQDLAGLSVPCEVFEVLADLILSRQS
jgi:geranylgeranyl diphosphate synthase type II